MRIVKEFEYRKIQAIVGDLSFSLVLPKQFVIDLGIGKGTVILNASYLLSLKNKSMHRLMPTYIE